MTQRLAAIDLGAESGRVVVGEVADGILRMRVVHRFATGARQDPDHWRWDLPAIQAGILAGLVRAAAQGPLAAIGIDTWGVDGTWIGAAGHPLAAPVSYRDPRTVGWPERLDAELGAGELFRRSGIAPMAFNTVYQLVAAHRAGAAPAGDAQWLFMPDLLAHWLSGEAACEWTVAGTSGLCRAGRMAWDLELIGRLGLPAGWFGRLVRSGTPLAPVRAAIWDALGTGTPPPMVVASAGHDTAAAFAAAAPPAGSAVVSCGTWSLVGAIVDAPVTTPDVLVRRLSNEIAADGRIRLLTNVMGLWVVQQCRAAFAAAGRDRDYAALTALAQAAPAPAVPLDVDDPRFFAPSTAADPMPGRVAAWYRDRGHPVPADDGAVVRAVTEGLAAAYARTCANLAAVVGQAPRALHVVGGGVKNRLLLDLAGRACGIPIVPGPSEATAIGNLSVVAAGAGIPIRGVDEA